MYTFEYRNARQALREAFRLCHKHYMLNKQRILRYLIPCEMIIGNFPTQKLLEQYDLREYIDLSRAAIRGDLPELEKNIEKYMDYFVSLGVYISVEKLRLVTLRNFIKRVVAAVKQTPELQKDGKYHMLQLKLIFRPL